MDRALAVYQDKDAWTGLMKAGMEADFSWNKSAEEYMEIYQTILM